MQGTRFPVGERVVPRRSHGISQWISAPLSAISFEFLVSDIFIHGSTGGKEGHERTLRVGK
uniref:Uncharacterized protein n=1 Tax=Candidatus Kentrum sp. LPFa TaxID=2126335 RepID=A0A450WLJ4_9GAMM|nr:MAG: hypothetical protein BECKLPF1236B_GA0070989_11287 [Candidatus Kentron sp. LPFa]